MVYVEIIQPQFERILCLLIDSMRCMSEGLYGLFSSKSSFFTPGCPKTRGNFYVADRFFRCVYYWCLNGNFLEQGRYFSCPTGTAVPEAHYSQLPACTIHEKRCVASSGQGKKNQATMTFIILVLKIQKNLNCQNDKRVAIFPVQLELLKQMFTVQLSILAQYTRRDVWHEATNVVTCQHFHILKLLKDRFSEAMMVLSCLAKTVSLLRAHFSFSPPLALHQNKYVASSGQGKTFRVISKYFLF